MTGVRPQLEYTGERMVPEWADRFTFWEHVYRYGFACRFVRGKRVLDIACGEGYGAAALQRAGATSVVGVDISEQACLHAREKYSLDVRVGRAEEIPVASGSVDLVVSFETIEHVPDPGRFLSECARVLVRRGRLVISTPNKDVYSRPGRAPNPYHCSEMTEREFLSALGCDFRSIRLFTQRPYSAPFWSLRSFALETEPGDTGLGRLRRSAQFRFFRRAVYDPSPPERDSVLDQILAANRGWANPFDLYAVRPRRTWGSERPLYLLGVAVRP